MITRPEFSPEATPAVRKTTLTQPQPATTKTVDTSDRYTVTKISDGDTIDVFKDGETIKVRLACIDAPESDQAPHGQASKDKLASLVPGEVELNIVDQDRYGRSVAEVYTPTGDFVNLEMVQSGNAVVYTEYLANCSDNAAPLLAAEQEAQSANRGVWADASFVMPWDYRQGVRAEVPEPEPTAIATPSPTPLTPATDLPACITSDCDCSDFSSWRQAQDVLESSPGDPHRLDGDKDGVACESLQ
jgi:micrococcal nuclease